MDQRTRLPATIIWKQDQLLLLDQTLLPHKTVYLTIGTTEQLISAIKQLSVRGAPAIGVAAAYGMLLGLEEARSPADLLKLLQQKAAMLKAARPTAVNLAWGVDAMLVSAGTALQATDELTPVRQALEEKAKAIHEEDRKSGELIARYGLALVEKFPRILTHCNAGALAVTGPGTALAPIYLAHDRGLPIHVWVDETRPLLQGARLTAFELQQAGVSMTLITDSMAASLMQQDKVDMVLVGADRIAINGDTANKIGTLSLAVNADYFKVPFFIAAPASTFDLTIPDGSGILIEQREHEEVTQVAGQWIAPAGTTAYNAAFDVTPASLISGWITDRGLVESASKIAGTIDQTADR